MVAAKEAEDMLELRVTSTLFHYVAVDKHWL